MSPEGRALSEYSDLRLVMVRGYFHYPACHESQSIAVLFDVRWFLRTVRACVPAVALTSPSNPSRNSFFRLFRAGNRVSGDPGPADYFRGAGDSGGIGMR